MDRIINLDISNKLKTTDYSFRIGVDYNIYFRLHDSDYTINYDDFNSLRLTIRYARTTRMEVVNLTEVVEFNNEKLIKWQVDPSLIEDEVSLNVSFIVNISGTNYNTSEMKIIVYKNQEAGMTGITMAIDNFNTMIATYLDSVKRKDIGAVNGVIGLDSNGKIDEKYLPTDLINHIPIRLIDTLDTVYDIHGMKINRENYKLEYYDNDDQEYYYANQIHGGILGFKNKDSSYNIFGGYLGEVTDSIDAQAFNTPLEDTVDAQSFSDNPSVIIDGGPLAIESEIEKYLNRIHGGYL